MQDLREQTDTKEEKQSKSDIAFERLRRMIVHLELQPGEVLREHVLSGLIDVGRTPLREALRRLNEMGLIVMRSGHSPQVAPIDAFEIVEVVEMRAILEANAARFAALRATDADRDRIVETNEVYRRAVQFGDLPAVLEADVAFHFAIAAAAHNRHLADAVGLISDFNFRLWTLAMRRAGPLRLLADQHDPIAAAILAGDADGADRAMRVHVELFRSRLAGLVQRQD